MALPRLDVNDVLYSPFFMDTFTVVRRQNMVDDMGRTRVEEEQIEATGVVQPSSPNSQDRTGGTARYGQFAIGRKAIVIYTPFRLRQESDGFAPDLVLYHGNDFQVDSVQDWTAYGRGFVVATATSQDLQDEPPPESP